MRGPRRAAGRKVSTRTSKGRRAALSALAVVAVLTAVLIPAVPTGAANTSAVTIDQCMNGALKPSLTLEPCQGSNGNGVVVGGKTYKNWVSGDANGSKAHWRENEFIAYRANISGIDALKPDNSVFVHSLVIQYDTVHSNVHALDYLGSFDTTETTSATSTQFNYNNSNPCSDFATESPSEFAGASCTPSAPQATHTIPLADLGNSSSGGSGSNTICGAAGTFNGNQIAGQMKLFGAAGSTIVDVQPLNENTPSGTGQCSSQLKITFTIPANIDANHNLVLAWGGHIASQNDWGFGNSASFISGSPYHMALVSLDNTTVGSQDQQLATSAVFFTPTITTVVENASNTPVPVPPANVTPGTVVHDTATLHNASPVAGGKVTYNRYNNINCSGSPATTEDVTVTNSVVPPSSSFTPTPGQYSYKAVYAGDAQDFAATGDCEPFQVSAPGTTIETHVHDATHNDITGSDVALNSVVHDSASVGPKVGSFSLAGTVTYTLYNGACGAGSVIQTSSGKAVDADGNVAESNASNGLAAGSYHYQAVYTPAAGSAYTGSQELCEPFQVLPASTTITTEVHDAAHNDITDEHVDLGSVVHDSASVGPKVNGFSLAGTVTYTLYNGACGAGSVIQTSSGKAVDANGNVAESDASNALAAGSYHYQAVYTPTAPSSYLTSQETCEPFTVDKASTTTETEVHDAAHNDITGAHVDLGSVVHDSASVGPKVGSFSLAGTVTYTLYNGACGAGSVIQTSSGKAVDADGNAAESNASNALAAGSYHYQVVYTPAAGSNYLGSQELCEPFIVDKAPTTTSTEVHDASHNDITGAHVDLGSVVHDSASVGPKVGSFSLAGTVTYTLYNGACGAGSVIQTSSGKAVDANGTAAESDASDPLAAGSYHYEVVFTPAAGSNYLGSQELCEPFSVDKAATKTSTEVHDASHNDITGTSVALNSVVHDSASVGPKVGSFSLAGTVTYTLYQGGCGGGSVIQTSAGKAVDADGTAAESDASDPLAAGSYHYEVVFTPAAGSNYLGSQELCEPFSVDIESTAVQTTVHDASHNDITGAHVDLGSVVHDSASVGPKVGTFSLEGTVTYTLYDGACGEGSVIQTSADKAVDADGNVVESDASDALAAGSYHYQAVYTPAAGSNYGGSQELCEPFIVDKAPTTTKTTVHDASHNDITGAHVDLGSVVHDAASVGPKVGSFSLAGTVTYTLYDGACGEGSVIQTSAGKAVDADGNAAESDASDPLAAGSYHYQVAFTPDAGSNYLGSEELCEDFIVDKAPTTTQTEVHDASHNDITDAHVDLGSVVHDSASVGPKIGSFSLEGTVTYTLYNDVCGKGSVIQTSAGKAVDADGTAAESDASDPLAAGSYHYQVVFTPAAGSNYVGSQELCEPFIVDKAQTVTSTEVHDASHNDITNTSVPLNSVVHDSASVGPKVGSFSLAGTVTYTLYNDVCGKGSVIQTSSGKAVDADGTAAESNASAALGVGSYHYQVVYTPTAPSNYVGSQELCEPFTVDKAETNTETAVHNTSHNDITNTHVALGSVVHDSASVGPKVGSFSLAGTVTYTLYNDVCGAGSVIQTSSGKAVDADGNAAESNASSALAAGSYHYQVVYTPAAGSNYLGSDELCEPFIVDKASTTTTTAVHNATHGDITNKHVALGSVVHDSASVGPKVGSFSLAGTVTYTLYNDVCGEGSAIQTSAGKAVDANGTAAESNASTALVAGSYHYEVSFMPAAGSNYLASEETCEPFTVDPANTSVATVVYDAATNAPIALTVKIGSSVYDTATVSGQVGAIVPTGTVTYYFFSGSCGTGTPISSQTVTLTAAGLVPHSNPIGPLADGTYYYVAVYSGDANYNGATGACEPFATGTPPLTPGYWKNHLDQANAVIQSHQPFYIGHMLIAGTAKQVGNSVTAIFKNMNCSNSSAQNAIGCLAGQLLAARLNIANGSVNTIGATITAAQQFLGINGVAVSVTYAGLTATGVVYNSPNDTFNLSPAQRALAVQLANDLSAYNQSGV